MASQVACAIAEYSASIDERDTAFCFFELQVIAPSPSLIHILILIVCL
jgi:hypothetical protein